MTVGRWLQFGALSLLLALGGCGGGSSGDSTASGGMGGSGSGSGQYAEGGMGGSGSGTSSGYGSIFVDEGRRHYPIDANADITVDGVDVAPENVNPQVPLGMTLEFVLAGDADADLTSGTAVMIEANHRVIGPVTGTDPLRVLEQPVLVTSETVLEGISAGGVDNLQVGDMLKVDGLVNSSGVIRATRLQAPVSGPSQWQLIGRAAKVDERASTLEIGGQPVHYLNAVVSDCGGEVQDYHRVLVRAEPTSGFTPGDPLNTLTLRCLSEGPSLFRAHPSAPAVLPVTVEGIITSLAVNPDGSISLSLNGQTVHVDPANLDQILFGTLDQLKKQVGARIEVVGSLDTTVPNAVIEARSLRFRDPLVDLTAPVDGGVVGKLLLTLGIEVHPTPLMQGATSLFDTPGSAGQVQVSGFLTDDGRLYAENIQQISPSGDAGNVSLLGPVDSVDNTTDRLVMAGTAFDTASAGGITVESLTSSLVKELCGGLLGLLDCTSGNNDLPPEVVPGASSDLSRASWNASQSRLETGDLLITLPTP